MRLLICFISLLTVQKALATSIDWSGGYRIEYNEIDRPTLGSDEKKGRKAYGLNYLYLTPKIVASDGINVVSRFDIFSNDINSYKNSQLGSIWGGGLTRAGGSDDGANVNSENQDASGLRVSQLYLTVNQENAVLIAGRAPIDFGLGITHNAGLNPFDHWYDTRDLLAYRFIIDNVSFMPMFTKVSQQDFGQGVITTEQSIVFEYDNKDNGAKAGLFYQTRSSSYGSNDANKLITGAPTGVPGAASVSSAWSTKTVNLFFGRTWEVFQFKLEASFLTGDTGIISTTNENIKYNAYAIAAEMLFPATEQSKWEWAAKFGTASGDNPATTGVVEGYQMDKNYDVAMLLFNHRMGQADFLTSNIIHRDAGLTVANSADDEAISNAIYVAPSVKYLWNDKLDLKTTVIYAQLGTRPFSSDSSKDLGTELDIELIYKPRERVIWSNGLGILFPGAAWKDGATGYDNKTNYGFTSKAAITF